MHKCKICGTYTLKEVHCGVSTVSAHPPPFNPNDKYIRYRVEWRYKKGEDDERSKDYRAQKNKKA